MKLKSDIVWAAVLIGTAVISFYLGTQRGTLESEKAMKTTVKEQAEKIVVLENKVQQLSEELESRGIYSYPQASVVVGKDDSATKVLIILNGKDAIRNLKMERKVVTNVLDDSELDFEDLPVKTKNNHIGRLTAHNPVAFEIESFNKNIFMELKFNSTGQQWHQYLIGRKTATGEIKTFWVITNQNSQVIDKHVDPGFPTDEDGNLLLGGKNEINYSDIQMHSKFLPPLIFD